MDIVQPVAILHDFPQVGPAGCEAVRLPGHVHLHVQLADPRRLPQALIASMRMSFAAFSKTPCSWVRQVIGITADLMAQR